MTERKNDSHGINCRLILGLGVIVALMVFGALFWYTIAVCACSNINFEATKDVIELTNDYRVPTLIETRLP